MNHATLQKLKLVELKFWQVYLAKQKNKDLEKAHVYAGYAGSPEITDALLTLYKQGKKTAGSSLMDDFLTAGDPLPEVGNHWIYLNGKGEPAAILKTIKVVHNKWKDITEEIAKAEGEGDLSLEYWKKVHAELWTPYLEQWGINDLNEATVITEFFEIVTTTENC